MKEIETRARLFNFSSPFSRFAGAAGCRGICGLTSPPGGISVSPSTRSNNAAISLNKDTILVIAICSAPFLLFAAAELAVTWRRRKWEAIARRSKARLAVGPGHGRRRLP